MRKKKRLEAAEIKKRLEELEDASLRDMRELTHEQILGEYKAILDDMAMMNSRRQNTNQLFVSINIVFMTALGFFLASSRLNSWWPATELAAIAVIIFPLNLIWLKIMNVYEKTVGIRHQTLQRIEDNTRIVGNVYYQYLKLGPTPIVKVERFIAYYFLGLYFLLVLGITAITALISTNNIPMPPIP